MRSPKGTDDKPDGLDNLQGKDKQRVLMANELYALTAKICLYVMRVEVEHVEGAKGQPVAICRWQGPLQSPADSGARRQNLRGARSCRAG